MTLKLGVLAGVLAVVGASAKADTFGSGANAFTIDFVNIGNAGNADDAGAGGGIYSSPYGGVPYTYRMGMTEAAQDWITKATALGLTNVTAGDWGPSQPATSMTWYEAAAFVNWLNTSTGHQAAYNLNGTAGALTLWSSVDAWQAGGQNLYRHKNAYYFLPSEDEWYKAAFHKNDGVTANYWDYALGSNSIPVAVGSGTTPGTAVYNSATAAVAGVNDNGGLSPYGTRGQNGNVDEWLESAFDGVNNSASENRAFRSGRSNGPEAWLRSSDRVGVPPTNNDGFFGFRVASVNVPEPSSAALMMGSGLVFFFGRRRGHSV